jgi:hypothetical protein
MRSRFIAAQKASSTENESYRSDSTGSPDKNNSISIHNASTSLQEYGLGGTAPSGNNGMGVKILMKKANKNKD